MNKPILNRFIFKFVPGFFMTIGVTLLTKGVRDYAIIR